MNPPMTETLWWADLWEQFSWWSIVWGIVGGLVLVGIYDLLSKIVRYVRENKARRKEYETIRGLHIRWQEEPDPDRKMILREELVAAEENYLKGIKNAE